MKRFLLVVALASCASDAAPDPRCRRSAECEDALCVGGRCQSYTRLVSDVGDAGDATVSALPDLPPLCEGAIAPTPATLALNEVLANVPSGADGDANGDGVRDAFDDEFVELVNISNSTVDLTGVRIASGGKLKHTFEPLCLEAGDSVVVFGGGSVGPSVMGNAVIAERRLSLSNAGGEVGVTGPDGLIATFAWEDAPTASLTRLPQFVGQTWVSHLEVSPLPFSPGRCPDGAPLLTRCTK